MIPIKTKSTFKESVSFTVGEKFGETIPDGYKLWKELQFSLGFLYLQRKK